MINEKLSGFRASSFLRHILFLLMIFFSFPLWAQSEEEIRIVDTTPVRIGGGSGRYVTEQRYIQRIAWVKDEFALRYEVVIERDDGQGFKSYLREFTEEPRYQISLLPGNYRYCIIPYDYLDQPCEASDWIILDVRIIPAVPVEIKMDDDDSYAIYTDDDPETEDVVIDAKKTEPEYINNFVFEAVWSPVIPIHGEISRLFGSKIYPVGAALRFGLLSTGSITSRFGLEFLAALYTLNNDLDENSIKINAGVLNLYLSFQQWNISQKLSVIFRTGGGIAFQTGEIIDEERSYMFGSMTGNLSFDAALLLSITKRWFFDIGINYTYFISDNSSGYLRPWLGIAYVGSLVNSKMLAGKTSYELVFYGNEHRYEIINSSRTWTDARRDCEKRGGYLATITSVEEQKFIENLVSKYGNVNNYWLGGYLESDEWQWVTGETFDYTNWMPGEPNNDNRNEDKLMLVRNIKEGINGKRGQWNDTNNNDHYGAWGSFGYICEWD